MTKDKRSELRELLDVSRDTLTERARGLFERESSQRYPTPLVLCGIGHLGGVVLNGIRKTDANVVALADNNPRRQGQTIDGRVVLSVEEAANRFRDSAVFVPTVYTARPLRQQLAKLGLRVASTRALFFQHAEAFLPYASVALPEALPSQVDDILRGFDLWSDDESKDEYVAQLAWHLLARTTVPDWTPAEQTYFPSGLVQLGDHEVFVDCGAFDGDSVRAFLARTGGQFDRVLALEPDPTNYAALRSFIDSLPSSQRDRITASQVAAFSKRSTLRFASASGAGSTVKAAGDIEVQADRLDEVLAGLTPTFIKMDIEGAEPDALAGASRALRESAPTLAVCLYHLREHLWQIPQLIRATNPSYRLYLRRHSDESWETVCYALPQA